MEVNLTKKQGELLESFNDDNITEILFGGGARGGKTYGIAEIINYTCVAYPGIAWLVGRREWDDLRKTSLVTLTKVLNSHGFKDGVDYKLNLQTKELHYKNGSRIFFVPLKQQPTDMEFNFLGGYELTFAFVDEAQEVSRKAINVINSRFTEKIKDYNLTGKIILGCNPDKGHLYSDFIKKKPNELRAVGRTFIQSLYTDNPYIDHEKYRESLKNADEVTKQRLLFGNWDYDNNPNKLFQTDEIYDMWSNPIQENGTRFISCDVARLGNDKTVIAVWDGNHLLKVESYQGKTTDQTVEIIKQLEIEFNVRRSKVVIDSDGVGGGVVDQLRGCKAFINNGRAVQPASSKGNNVYKVNFQNLKTQAYFELKKLMEKGSISISEGAIHDIADKENLIQELENIMLVDIDKDNKIKLESKEDLKNRIGRSPDFADAIMMKMYFNIMKETEVSTINTTPKFHNKITGQIQYGNKPNINTYGL